MTVRQLTDEYLERYVRVKRAARAAVFEKTLAVICRTPIPHLSRGTLPLGDWPVAEVVSDSVERFREARLAQGTGVTGTNRYLGSLRALWSWGLAADHVTSTPFKRHGEPVVKLQKEHPRSRRLDDGEEQKLLAVSGPYLRGVVIAALETGIRKGEIVTLQWEQVEGAAASTGSVSPAGDPFATFPPSVPRFWICTPPISRAARARIGRCRPTSGERMTSVYVASAPMDKSLAAHARCAAAARAPRC